MVVRLISMFQIISDVEAEVVVLPAVLEVAAAAAAAAAVATNR